MVDVRGWYLRDTLARRTRQLLHGTELLPAGDGLHRTTQSTRQGSTLQPPASVLPRVLCKT